MAKKTADTVVFRFNVANPRANRKIEELAGKSITRISKDTREAARKAILDGYAKGRHPNSIALDLAGRVNRTTGRREGGILGMSATQAEAALNLRDRLQSGEPSEMRKVLGMALRDKRFDSKIERAIEERNFLDADDVERMYNKYVDNAVLLRGETVARTETGEAVHAAEYEAFAQGLEKSGYSKESVTRIWRTAGDGKVRDSHADMDGQEVQGLEEPFESGSGNSLMYPLDDSMGADVGDIVNCRCDVELNIDFSEGVDEESKGNTAAEDDKPSAAEIKSFEQDVEKLGTDINSADAARAMDLGFSAEDAALALRDLGAAGELVLAEAEAGIFAGSASAQELLAAEVAKKWLTEAVIDILRTGGGTIDEMANELARRFPDKSPSVLRKSLEVRLLRFPKQGIMDIDNVDGRYVGRNINTKKVDKLTKPPKIDDVRAPPPITVVQPDVNDPVNWHTPDQAMAGFRSRHDVGIAPWNERMPLRERAVFVERVKEVDKELTRLKETHENIKEKSLLGGGIRLATNGKHLAYGRSQEAYGLYYPGAQRLELAGSLQIKHGASIHGEWAVSQASLAGTFRHELGHALEALTMHHVSQSRYELERLAKDVSTLFPTRYSKTNGAELFAESFSAWAHPDYGKPGTARIDEKLVKIFETVFKKRKRNADRT